MQYEANCDTVANDQSTDLGRRQRVLRPCAAILGRVLVSLVHGCQRHALDPSLPDTFGITDTPRLHRTALLAGSFSVGRGLARRQLAVALHCTSRWRSLTILWGDGHRSSTDND